MYNVCSESLWRKATGKCTAAGFGKEQGRNAVKSLLAVTETEAWSMQCESAKHKQKVSSLIKYVFTSLTYLSFHVQYLIGTTEE